MRLTHDLVGDGRLSPQVLVGQDRELDLYVLRNRGLDVTPGTVFQLAVVAVSSSGKCSNVVLQDIEVKALDAVNAEIPASLEYVSFTPNPGVEGSPFIVTLRNRADVAGRVYLEWYRNLGLSRTESKEVQPGAEVSFLLDGSLVLNDDAWSFKAYFEAANAERSRSRSIPPTLNNVRNPESDNKQWVFRLVGKPYDEVEYEEENKNHPPTVPTNVVIVPFEPDVNSLLIATASGSVDPEGDRFTYYYQWYRAEASGSSSISIFEPVVGQNQPYWQREVITIAPTTTATSTGTAGATADDTTGGDTATGDTATGGTTTTGGTDRITVTQYTLSEHDRLYVVAYAMDIYGNKSPRYRSSIITIMEDFGEQADDSSISMAYEPNNRWETEARQLLPKTDWWDMDDEAVQTHYFHARDDVDWVWFIVPASMSFAQKRVLFETNASSENEGVMYTSQHIASRDPGPDTQLTLYRYYETAKGNPALERLFTVDDFGTVKPEGSIGGTKFARFDRLLDPGIYYVKVELASRQNWAMEAPYAMHLLIEETGSAIGPSAPVVELTPERPMPTEDLVCEIVEESISEAGLPITYFYVWYRDGQVVPFGNNNEVKPWETERFKLSMAKNHHADGDPAVIPSIYTNPGEVWHCEVYAMDEYGYSELPVVSNAVIIGGELGRYWGMELLVKKEYRGRIGLADDQVVVLGWHDLATHGFDPSLDESMPNITVPAPGGGTVFVPLAEGRSYSTGLDNEHISLNTDIRPYGKGTSWFVVIEMGDPTQDSIAECRLSWQVQSLPEETVDGISITQMRKRSDGVFEAIPGTQMLVEAGRNVVGQIVLDEVALRNLQTDASGQAYAVFRISIGAPNEFQVFDFGVTNAGVWKPGWQLVSMKLTPLNNAIDEIFVIDGQKIYRGVVWMYEDGRYVAATHMVAGRGYWMYIPKRATELINVYGSLGTSIPLNTGWNIIGPIHDIKDFKSTYNEQEYPGILKKIVKPEGDPSGLQIFKFVVNEAGDPDYDLALDQYGLYNLDIGNGYWIESKETFELPVVPPKNDE